MKTPLLPIGFIYGALLIPAARLLHPLLFRMRPSTWKTDCSGATPGTAKPDHHFDLPALITKKRRKTRKKRKKKYFNVQKGNNVKHLYNFFMMLTYKCNQWEWELSYAWYFFCRISLWICFMSSSTKHLYNAYRKLLHRQEKKLFHRTFLRPQQIGVP